MRVTPALIRSLSAALLALASFGSAAAAVYNVRNYGATGDGRTNDTRAIQAAIDAAGQAGGGEVYFPDGNYRSVRLTLRSNLVVNIAPGAVVAASPAADDWSQLNLATLIYARKADHITLEGGGTLDGGGLAYYDSAGNFAPGDRPQTVINLVDSTYVTIRHLTLRNSTRWTVVLDGVIHSLVDHVTIRNREFGLSRESDGIDLDSCRHAVVQNCDIETGDDAICLKPQNKHGAFDMYDILVQDCTVATNCNAVKIGTGTSTNLYDVRCRNITVNRHSQIRTKGNPIKTDAFGSENGSCISAIAVESNDGGSVHDITYENFTINDCDTPIFVEVENRQTYLPHAAIGTVYNITFSNITCRSSARASQINDQAPGQFHNLTFNNLEIHNRETYDGNASPLRLAGGYPDAQKCGRMPAYGLFARDVDGLNFTGRIVFHDDGHSHRPAFASENVSVTGAPSPAPVAVSAAGPPAAIDDSFAAHVNPALPVIPDHTFKLTDFGAVGDGQTLNTEAFQKAIAAVAQAGGGTLVIPKGVFRTLPFTLCSNLDLHLEAGAVIQAPGTFAAYGMPDPASLHSLDEVAAKVTYPAPLISGNNLHDLAITGTGTIDGSGAKWWPWHGHQAQARPGRVEYRPISMVVISGCQRLHVADVTLANSPHFHLVAKDITDLLVERVKTRAPANAANTDGIDIGPGTNFLVRDCDCSDGDDDICIKDGGTNILIENCTIHQGHGISIGSGTAAGVHNMLVRHCTFDGSKHALRIKSMRGAGGEVSNIHFTDIQIKNVTDFIWVISDYVDSGRPNFKGDPKLVPLFHHVLFDHITAEKVQNAGRIVGLADSPISDVTLRDVTIQAENPFEIKHADHLVFDDVTINGQPSPTP